MLRIEVEFMSDQDNKVLTDILERMVRVETKIDVMSEIKSTATTASYVAEQAKNSAAIAHQRLDKIDKWIFWFMTTVGGAVIIAVLSLVLKKG